MNTSMFLNLNLPTSNSFVSFSSTFNHHTIEINYRKFFLTVLKAFSNKQWRLLNITYNLLKGNMNSIDWSITWQLFYNLKNFWYKLMKLLSRWSFLLKCFSKLLLLGDVCLTRKPELYKDLNCLACHNLLVTENWNHLFTCTNYCETWNIITTKCQTEMVDFINKMWKSHLVNSSTMMLAEQIIQKIWNSGSGNILISDTNHLYLEIRKLMTEGKILAHYITQL